MNSFTIWTAGFFDGEGCIRIEIGKRGRHKIKPTLVVTVSQRNAQWLLPIKDRWGGHIKQDRAWNSLRLKSLSAEKFLRALRPYLIVKRKQADVALEYRHKFIGKHRGRGHAYSDTELAELHTLVKRLSELKRA